MKGQTSMAVVVIAIVMLVFLAIFLLTMTEPSGNADAKAEYRKLYATNMLLSLLNTQTSDCGSFSDMLKGSYFGGGKCDDEVFGNRIGTYIPEILYLSGHTDYDWFIVASPKNFEGTEQSWGNAELRDDDGYACNGCWGVSTMLTWGGSMLDVKIYMKTK
jgi:hypothetical protein